MFTFYLDIRYVSSSSEPSVQRSVWIKKEISLCCYHLTTPSELGLLSECCVAVVKKAWRTFLVEAFMKGDRPLEATWQAVRLRQQLKTPHLAVEDSNRPSLEKSHHVTPKAILNKMKTESGKCLLLLLMLLMVWDQRWKSSVLAEFTLRSRQLRKRWCVAPLGLQFLKAP